MNEWWNKHCYAQYRFELWMLGCTSNEMFNHIVNKQERTPLLQAIEKNILSKDPEFAYWYALLAIRGAWPLGEKTIASDPEFAYGYARNIIEGPWPLGEATIIKDEFWRTLYESNIGFSNT